MRKNDTQMKKSELLPFHIIKAASEGDVEPSFIGCPTKTK